MSNFKPQLFTTPLKLLIPTYENVKGVTIKKYPNIDESPLIFASFKTYGGTETNNNGIYSVIDTANIETWYRPDISSDCQILNLINNGKYEVIGEPENINMRNQYLKFKVRRIKSGA